ncbi:MAG: FAD-linked oxidase C-terminal domain-containing protein [Candidatus Binatus sp.]|uniref:FAD-binding oxidoreductase n=1 Tax=Candidatus Binatus sp. TaxID=2811406 RepID=UPI00271A9CD7|nr:FAD-linked oxidase C-terminal domain-containing protein [Candidatus Binatus sp.]MDO8432516.1 FAD-linked oxidase C-terminal domain-containing protein [Candidatus Binatus sp.]
MNAIDPTLLEELRAILGSEAIVSRATELKVYECDGWTVEKSSPDVLLMPSTTAQLSAVMAALSRRNVAFVPRGAGTGLSGGCLPLNAPAMICTSKMNRILGIDYDNRRVEVESGVVNLHVTNAVKARGYFYAPDPSSQVACTIGGNIAENSGGPHTLKNGVTTNHVLALELVLPDGEIVELGGPTEERCGYDLVGAVVGAEGTTGIVARATLRLTREPENHRTLLASFPDVDTATRAVSMIIASGILPGALEMMDQLIIRAVEDAFHVGLPADAGAVLIIELDGLEAGLSASADAVAQMTQSCGATSVKLASDEAERALLWKARKRAFGAVGRLAPNYATQDGVVPRTCLPQILRVITAVSRRYDLRIGNVFHAGDGNLHPVILYDEREPGQVQRAIDAGRDILKACIEMGGSLTGEHGIGVEKIGEMPLLFSPDDLRVMTELRHVFDPMNRSNPGKVIPEAGACVEVSTPRRQVPI